MSAFPEQIAYQEGSLSENGDLLFEVDKRPFIARLAGWFGSVEGAPVDSQRRPEPQKVCGWNASGL